MAEIIFRIIFPLVLLGFLIILLLAGRSRTAPKQDLMSLDDFIKDWLKDHGQGHKLEEQFAQMKKDPSGSFYMPMTYKGAKIFIKWGISPNKVTIMNLILSFFIFYGVIIASEGQTLDLISQQPFYGFIFLPVAFLVAFTGIIDGIDGTIARLLNIKSKTGAWLDNIIDRISDILMLVCLVPTSLLIIPSLGLDFTWIVWTNILLIFIYEYMRARHEGLGLLETKPFAGERITRIIIMVTFFLIYGISSFIVMITYLINPTTAAIWSVIHGGIVTWCMLIYQVVLLFIMVMSSLQSSSYIWKQLKTMENKNG